MQSAHPGTAAFSSARNGYLIVIGLLLAGVGFGQESTGPKPIYRCEVQGKVTFSDQRCAAPPGAKVESSEVVLKPTNSYHAAAPSSALSRSTTSSTAARNRQAAQQRNDSLAAELDRHKQSCQRLADQLTNIEYAMRAGYTASQGEKMRERQRQLEQKRKTERCG